ncbi:hypothetical protein PPROV_000811200 [Pycnococcus provasolii]|uniref:Undecaprenyldiphospho-muramoylpentapeptide beta-N-acetylglucosaminyltransferase n=1 Tax=Pycnococcus provasolii TaxID=41880 RepID=A0A830HWR9_9CHLO|nr:hypothetical protein PPROV_000811200 [Pycnococcus provasolii]
MSPMSARLCFNSRCGASSCSLSSSHSKRAPYRILACSNRVFGHHSLGRSCVVRPYSASHVVAAANLGTSKVVQTKAKPGTSSSEDATANDDDDGGEKTSSEHVVIAAGGTGGHVFPAIAVAEAIESQNNNVSFVGTAQRMEAKTVPESGYEFDAVPSMQMYRPWFRPRNLLLPFAVVAAVFSAWRVLARRKAKCVLGTGGYVAAPVCIAAALRGTPVIIQEQNAVPGLANAVLAASGAARIAIVASEQAKRAMGAVGGMRAVVAMILSIVLRIFGNSTQRAQVVLEANPLRRSFVDAAKGGKKKANKGPVVEASRRVLRARARQSLLGTPYTNNAQVLVVLGGSLGARPVNDVFANPTTGVTAMLEANPQLHVLWQCGRGANYEDVVAAVEPHPRLRIAPFLDNDAMREALLAADVAVCRAGALTVAELTLFGVPSVLVPSPYVADDHQTANARALAETGAAEIVLESDLSTLPDTVIELLNDAARRRAMSESARATGMLADGAAERIAQTVLEAARGD